jgi:hypothetical protein
MGGFSTPGSNTRTADLPNPRPVGLQSRCSVLPGSLSLNLCQPQPRARPTHGGYPPLNHAGFQPSGPTPCWNTHPLAMLPHPWPPGSPPPVHTEPQPRPSSQGLPGYPPTEPTALQTLLSPSYMWDNWTPTPWTSPTHQALLGSSSMWNNWSRALLGPAPSWRGSAASTAYQEPYPWSEWPQLHRLPR